MQPRQQRRLAAIQSATGKPQGARRPRHRASARAGGPAQGADVRGTRQSTEGRPRAQRVRTGSATSCASGLVSDRVAMSPASKYLRAKPSLTERKLNALNARTGSNGAAGHRPQAASRRIAGCGQERAERAERAGVRASCRSELGTPTSPLALPRRKSLSQASCTVRPWIVDPSKRTRPSTGAVAMFRRGGSDCETAYLRLCMARRMAGAVETTRVRHETQQTTQAVHTVSCSVVGNAGILAATAPTAGRRITTTWSKTL